MTHPALLAGALAALLGWCALSPDSSRGNTEAPPTDRFKLSVLVITTKAKAGDPQHTLGTTKEKHYASRQDCLDGAGELLSEILEGLPQDQQFYGAGFTCKEII